MTSILARSRLLLLSGAALAVGLAACSDEQKDDEDEGPFVAARCAIYWGRENPNDGTLDVYAVDQPIEDWVSGTGEYEPGAFPFGDGPIGWFAYRTPDGSLLAALALAKVTNGEFTLAVAGTSEGLAVSFTAGTAGVVVVDARDPGIVGSSTGGDFTGVWSDPRAESSSDIDWGTGSITIVYLGSSITLGGGAFGGESSYAQCSDGQTGFAPVTGPGHLRFLRSGT